MATLTVNGRKVTVDDSFRDLSPEQQQATVEEISKSMGQSVGVGEDVARSGASGLRSGIEGLAGAMGSANKATGDLASWLASKLGAGDETAQTIGNVARRINPLPMSPTTDEIQQTGDRFIGEAYEPQTTAGEYARTVGEFAPSAALGPGGAVRKTAMAVVPAVISETAGQLTEGTEYEPWMRVAGAVAGGGLAAGRGNVAKEAAKGAPTAEKLSDVSNTAYKTLREVGIQYHPGAYAKAITDASQKLVKKGFRQSNAKEAFAMVDDLAKEIGGPKNFDDINALVSSLGGTARDLRASGQKQQAKALDIVREQLMRLEETAPIVSRIPLDRARLNQVRSQVRDVAFRNIKERVLQEVVDKADTYAAGVDAGIRNGINNLLRSNRGMQMFKGEERKALLEVAQGRKAVQTLAKFGLSLGKGQGNSTFIPLLGGIASGGLTLAAGGAAKEAAPFFTGKALETARAAIRSGKLRDNAGLSAAQAERMKANVRRLLATEAGLSSAQ